LFADEMAPARSLCRFSRAVTRAACSLGDSSGTACSPAESDVGPRDSSDRCGTRQAKPDNRLQRLRPCGPKHSIRAKIEGLTSGPLSEQARILSRCAADSADLT